MTRRPARTTRRTRRRRRNSIANNNNTEDQPRDAHCDGRMATATTSAHLHARAAAVPAALSLAMRDVFIRSLFLSPFFLAVRPHARVRCIILIKVQINAKFPLNFFFFHSIRSNRPGFSPRDPVLIRAVGPIGPIDWQSLLIHRPGPLRSVPVPSHDPHSAAVGEHHCDRVFLPFAVCTGTVTDREQQAERMALAPAAGRWGRIRSAAGGGSSVCAPSSLHAPAGVRMIGRQRETEGDR